MDKQYRKQLEQQLAVTIDYFLRKTDEKSAEKMAKYIKSASKDLAKKFIKTKEAIRAKVIKDNNDIGKKPPLSVNVVPSKKAPAKKKVEVKTKVVAAPSKSVSNATKKVVVKKALVKKPEQK